jgi:ATP-dependent helicase HrpA
VNTASTPAALLRVIQDQLLIRDAARFTRLLAQARKPIDAARFAHDLEQARQRAEQRAALVPATIDYPQALPVTQARERLVEAIRAHSLLVVCGETGSGKSTQLPKLLLEAGCGRRGLIGHTQPRRLAARTLAQRIAQELGVPLGDRVGFETRFDRRTSERTLIKLMTDGILLAELARDRWLEGYDAIIIDEAHERTLNIDFLLGRLKQIHERRPDLKIIITSATLDPERLSKHFNDAPILNVEGRSYPVETRYREPIEDEELEDQVASAIEGLWRGGKQANTLVFLPGEREINDLIRMLSGRFPHAQVLPLYSRLPAAQQDRAFASGGAVKIICTTNVAETSVTVPGIRYVIDSGSARVNRFAPRLGVQHLEIEPISQAAANQRAGRCGRVGPGICMRLYTEDDFTSRALFTDPEIKRANLAGVILQMASLRLGDIDAFPWVESPESRHVADGYRLLQVLGALDDEREITALGRELARLPLDPRVARIALAGREAGVAADFVYVLAAALSIQDPHEVPPDAQQAARQKHAEWRHDRSDYMTLLQLWQRWLDWNANNSKRALRRVCAQHFVSWTRMQEWDALYRQIVDLRETQAAAEEPRRSKLTPDELYEPIHKALLTGLIDHIGQKRPEPVKREGRTLVEYIGPRGRRFRLFPGSALAKKTPDWIMCAQLAQTSSLFARTNAAITPEWLVQVGAHLVKRALMHPQWNAKRGEVTAIEHLSLLGMPLTQRPCHYGAHHPAEARQIFIRDALVRGQLPHKPEFLEHNLQLIDEIRDKEARLRRPDLLADDDQLYAFYDARIPSDVCTIAALKAWLRRSSRPGDSLGAALRMGEPDALRSGANADISSQFPDHFDISGQRLRLSYRHEPGQEVDGLSVHVPLAQLHTLGGGPFEWLVPGLRLALFEGLIRSLPNDKRRRCTPAAAWAQALNESLTPADGELLPVICARFRSMIGVELEPADFQPQALESHLRARFIVEDEQGERLAEGESLPELQRRMREPARASLRETAGQQWQRESVTDWDFGDLPAAVSVGNAAQAVPAVVVEKDHVALRVFESVAAATAAHREGVRALLLQKLADRVRDLRKACKPKFGMSLIGTPLTPEQLADELIASAADELIGDEAPRDNAGFAALIERRVEFSQLGYKRLDEIAAWLAGAADVRRKLAVTKGLPPSAADLKQQLADLFAPGFVRAVPEAQWSRVSIYVRAAGLRLERMANKPQRDIELTQQLAPLVARLPSAWHPARWLIEEWRVQLFAQELRAVGAPTAAKIDEALRA